MRKDYDLVGSYDNQRVSSINAERTVNLFEYLDPQGKRPKVLLPTAGLTDANLSFGTETGGSRATFVFDNAIYQVYGGSIFRTTGSTGALSTSLIGTLSTTTGYVGIDANTFQVIFVDGVQGFIWNVDTEMFEQITDPAFPEKPIDVTFIDGFFLVANGDTNTFQLSTINQGLIWGVDNDGTESTFTMAAGVSDIVITYNTIYSISNYQIGTPVTFSGGGLPAELTAGTTYYVVAQVSATTIRVSATQGGTAITSAAGGNGNITNNGQLQLGSITSHPGNIVGCRTLHRRIFLFSSNYTEVWENAGLGTNLPIRRNNSLLMEVGTPAVGSISVGFDRMFFLAQDKDGLAGVMEVRGTESIPVSNRALDFQLAQYAADPNSGVSDARGVLIKENGIIFYRLNFTLANHTFVFNVSMSTPEQLRWHEEEVLNGDRHPAETHAFFDGVNYYGSYNSPIFYIVDNSVSTNDGETIRRMRIGRQMTPEGYNRLRIDRFQVDLLQGSLDILTEMTVDLLAEDEEELLTESGEVLLLDQTTLSGGGQPVVFLAVSRDGGQSYGNYLQATMGKIGQRTYRTVWRKIGTTPRGQGFVPKIEFFNEIPFVVLGAAWDFEVLPE